MLGCEQLWAARDRVDLERDSADDGVAGGGCGGAGGGWKRSHMCDRVVERRSALLGPEQRWPAGPGSDREHECAGRCVDRKRRDGSVCGWVAYVCGGVWWCVEVLGPEQQRAAGRGHDDEPEHAWRIRTCERRGVCVSRRAAHVCSDDIGNIALLGSGSARSVGVGVGGGADYARRTCLDAGCPVRDTHAVGDTVSNPNQIPDAFEYTKYVWYTNHDKVGNANANAHSVAVIVVVNHTIPVPDPVKHSFSLQHSDWNCLAICNSNAVHYSLVISHSLSIAISFSICDSLPQPHNYSNLIDNNHSIKIRHTDCVNLSIAIEICITVVVNVVIRVTDALSDIHALSVALPRLLTRQPGCASWCGACHTALHGSVCGAMSSWSCGGRPSARHGQP